MTSLAPPLTVGLTCLSEMGESKRESMVNPDAQEISRALTSVTSALFFVEKDPLFKIGLRRALRAIQYSLAENVLPRKRATTTKIATATIVDATNTTAINIPISARKANATSLTSRWNRNSILQA